jgi:hypothetical protein
VRLEVTNRVQGFQEPGVPRFDRAPWASAVAQRLQECNKERRTVSPVDGVAAATAIGVGLFQAQGPRMCEVAVIVDDVREPTVSKLGRLAAVRKRRWPASAPKRRADALKTGPQP